MKVQAHSDVDQFTTKYFDWWLANEAENCVFLRLKQRAPSPGDTFIDVTSTDGNVLLTSFVNPKDQIVLSRASSSALAALSSYLYREHISFPGIFAPNPTSLAFAQAQFASTDRRFLAVKQMIHMELSSLKVVNFSSGTFRKAEMCDSDVIADFRKSSQREGNTQRPFDSSSKSSPRRSMI